MPTVPGETPNRPLTDRNCEGFCRPGNRGGLPGLDGGQYLEQIAEDRSLLGADEIVAGRVSILDASRRNRNFKVIRQGAPGLFVKQMRDMQTDAMLTLKREAACYELARDIPELARIMPRLVRYDERRHTIVLELLPDAESLLAYHARNKG